MGCEEPCEDCNCDQNEEEEETQPEIPTAKDILSELNKMGLVQRPTQPEPEADDNRLISIDTDNADLYAFSSQEFINMRQRKDAVEGTNPLDWSNQEITNIARQVVGNKLDV